jgi:hypothetical protein
VTALDVDAFVAEFGLRVGSLGTVVAGLLVAA